MVDAPPPYPYTLPRFRGYSAFSVATDGQAAETTIFKRYMIRGLLLEAGVILIAAALFSLVSPAVGQAVLLGGLVYAVPHGLFTLMSLRHIGDTQSARLLMSLAVGFFGKLVFIALALGLIFTGEMEVSGLPLMLALVIFYLFGLILTGFLSSKAAAAAEEA